MRARRGQQRLEIDIDSLEEDLKGRVDGEVRFDTASRALYVSDASNYRQVPIGVVIPRTTDAVAEAVSVCREHGAPIVSRGGGTGLCGQTCNVAVVIDHSKYLNKILGIDPERKLARVQPGTILDHLREEADSKFQLTFGPDPATHSRCTLGGMIGNNSCGIHSVMAGRTVDNVHEMEVLTYDGLRMRVGRTSDEEIERIIAAGGRRGDVYLRLRKLRDRYADLIRERYPRIPRRVSGYNLDELLPENGFNVARALVGTESTCVTVLEATLKLIWSPPGRSLLVLGYPDVYAAGDHIPQIMQYGPIGCEGIDDQLVQFMEKKGLNVQYVKLLPEGNGWLVMEFGGVDRKDSDERARRAMEALAKTKSPPSMKLYDDPYEEEMIWKIRESGLGATANVPGLPLSWPGWEDAAVPPERIGDYLREFRRLLNEFGLIASLYGHFGQGCVHCRISFDLFTHEGVVNYMRFIDKASDLVVRYGGSFSAEHGDGQSKALFLPKMYGGELMDAFREFKTIWDSEWKMNPGKVVEPYRPDENLRFGADYRPWQPDTFFTFPNDKGSFSRATLRCVGVGKCREPHRAFMCPSFLATREEQHTTRGRAHLLFEMFKGDLIRDGWKSREVRETLELCLGCKGCKAECPVNVDMAMYKSEFFEHYYAWRLRPRSHYAMGLIGYWGPLAARMPRISNVFTQAPLLGAFTKFAGGYDRRRSIPKFAPSAFSRGYKRGDRDADLEKVLLIPDLYNDVFFPETLFAAAKVLKNYGFDVELPSRNPREIRPLLHYGMIGRSIKELKRAIGIMAPYAEKGVPIIFLEPSTASVYRDEMTELLPNDRDAMRIKEHSFLLPEFIQKRRLKIPKLEGRAVLHGHCHQKAVLDPGAARNIIKKMGLDLEEPQPGCCGMAGSFGLEPQHYDISIAIGEEGLLPAIRNAKKTTYIVAEGFSCRSQILDLTDRVPLHIAELMEKAFRASPGDYTEPEGDDSGKQAEPKEKEYETAKV